MNRFFFILIVFLSLNSKGYSQELNLIGRGNLGIGFDYITQDFKGLKTFYSPGGGLGFEGGLEGDISRFEDTFWYGTIGMTINLNMHYEEVNGTTTKTSFGWNKKFFTLGGNRYFDIRNKFINDFYGGGGLTLSIPGTLRRTENNKYKGRIKYHTALGFQLHAGSTLDIGRDFLLRPEIRYRYINYNSKSYTRGNIQSLEPELRKARGQGIDISLTLVKEIKGGRR